jgi:molybdopterin-guanine dinucleotide biosynthesis protein A
MTTGRLDAIVLCGGESRRMGRDKASLPFGPETLVERVVRLVTPFVSDVVLAAAPGQAVPPGVRVSRDSVAGVGPLPALLDALDGVDGDHVFVVACDTPLLQPGLVTLLRDLCAEITRPDGSATFSGAPPGTDQTSWDGAVPVVQGRRVATCAVYRTAALREARARFGDVRHRSLQAFLEPLRIREVGSETLRTADPELLSFTPCNTAEEYRRALALAGGWQGSRL